MAVTVELACDENNWTCARAAVPLACALWRDAGYGGFGVLRFMIRTGKPDRFGRRQMVGKQQRVDWHSGD
jgi:hypothetical protein